MGQATLPKHHICPWGGGHMSDGNHLCVSKPRDKCCDEQVVRGHPAGSANDTEEWCVNCGHWWGVPEW